MHPALQRSSKDRNLPFRSHISNKLRQRVIALACPEYPKILLKSACDLLARDQRLEEARAKLAATAVDEAYRARTLATAEQIAGGDASVEDFSRIGTGIVAAELSEHRASIIETQQRLRHEAANIYQQLAPLALEAVTAYRSALEKSEAELAVSLNVEFIPSNALAAIASVEILFRENLEHKVSGLLFQDKPVETSIGFLIPEALRK